MTDTQDIFGLKDDDEFALSALQGQQVNVPQANLETINNQGDDLDDFLGLSNNTSSSVGNSTSFPAPVINNTITDELDDFFLGRDVPAQANTVIQQQQQPVNNDDSLLFDFLADNNPTKEEEETVVTEDIPVELENAQPFDMFATIVTDEPELPETSSDPIENDFIEITSGDVIPSSDFDPFGENNTHQKITVAQLSLDAEEDDFFKTSPIVEAQKPTTTSTIAPTTTTTTAETTTFDDELDLFFGAADIASSSSPAVNNNNSSTSAFPNEQPTEEEDNFATFNFSSQSQPFDGNFTELESNSSSLFAKKDTELLGNVPDINENTAFGEEVEFPENDIDLPNPFCYDRFTSAKATSILLEEEKMKKVDGTSIQPRARPRPQRQDTLSGNNPFRKGSLQDEMLAADLVDTVLAVGSSATELIKDLEKPTKPKKQLTPEDGFDPLQTIYPDSDDDSGDDDGGGPTPLKIKIQGKSMTTTINKGGTSGGGGGGVLPLLPAPPRAEDIIAAREKQEEALRAKQEAEEAELELSAYGKKHDDDFWGTIEAGDGKSRPNDDDGLFFNVSWGDQENKSKADLPSDLFDINTSESQEVENFEPFVRYEENMTWKFLMRMPEKKNKTKQFSRHLSDRFWKEVYVKLIEEKDRPVLLVYDAPQSTDKGNKEASGSGGGGSGGGGGGGGDEGGLIPLGPNVQPFKTLRLEPTMQLSRDKLQQYDQYGKLHIVKVNLIVYRETVGMRTEKFSLKTLQNIMGHRPKSNMVYDHVPVRTELLKLGSLNKKLLRSLMFAVEDKMMKIPSHSDTSLTYTKEELCCYVQDEYEAKLDAQGTILHQIARTRVFFVAFVIGRPYIILGVNDIWRHGKEVVRRTDIIPMMHDDWIHIYQPEFHSCINMEEYEKDHMIKFHPLDGCKFELMRFRVSLRGNRELPLTCTCTFKIDKLNVLIRCDLMAPGFFSASKRHGSTHCNDIEIRIPIPEEWIYHFRVEKRMKYGSMHSTLRKPGKIKGFERITQIAQSFLPASLMEASAGVAKYEHLYKALVWRIPRLPEKHEGAFKPHLLTCKLTLGAHDPVPEWDKLDRQLYVEYSMNSSTVSGATVRSISIEQHDGNPEKFVKYLAKYEYNAAINYELGERKAPALKSILDDVTNDNEADDDDDDDDDGVVVHNDDENNEQNGGETLDGGGGCDTVMDLLGGTEPQQSQRGPSPTPKSNLDDLADIFGSS